eukprot:gene4156-2998_t
MDVSDIGAELWAVIHHLFSSRNETAFAELCLRTGLPYAAEDHALQPITLLNLRSTKWYETMKERYHKQMEVIQVQHRSRFEEAEEMAQMLYPKGCSLSDYAEAVNSCISMLTFTIPLPIVAGFLQRQDEARMNGTSFSVTGAELVHDMRSIVQESVFPQRWWAGVKGASAVRATRVGVQLRPSPIIAIEYEHSSGLHKGRCRCRRIHLPPSVLEVNHPIGTVSRRLANSHGALLTETAFQKLILDMQRLEQRRRDDTASVDVAAATPPSSSPPPAAQQAAAPPLTASRSRAVDEPQEADLGLLYRDPEAALNNVDLNHADDDTVKEFKEVMDIKFNEHVLKPGDEGYEYDKRVAVQPTQKSDWDDSDDEF